MPTLPCSFVTLVTLVTLTAASIGGVLVGAVAALDDAVAHHGVEQALLPVLAHKVHVAGAQGLCRDGAGQGDRAGTSAVLAASTVTRQGLCGSEHSSGRILGIYREFLTQTV